MKTAIEKTFTTITYSMEHDSKTYYVSESFDHKVSETDFEVSVVISKPEEKESLSNIACDSDEYNYLRNVFYDTIEDDHKKESMQ